MLEIAKKKTQREHIINPSHRPGSECVFLYFAVCLCDPSIINNSVYLYLKLEYVCNNINNTLLTQIKILSFQRGKNSQWNVFFYYTFYHSPFAVLPPPPHEQLTRTRSIRVRVRMHISSSLARIGFI